MITAQIVIKHALTTSDIFLVVNGEASRTAGGMFAGPRHDLFSRANYLALAVKPVCRWLSHTTAAPILSVKTPSYLLVHVLSSIVIAFPTGPHDSQTYSPRSTRFDFVSSPHCEHVFEVSHSFSSSASTLRSLLRTRATGRCGQTSTSATACSPSYPNQTLERPSVQLTVSVPAPRATRQISLV